MKDKLRSLIPKRLRRMYRRIVPYHPPIPEFSHIADLELIHRIQTAASADLLSRSYLEFELIPVLGLNDEHIAEYPEELRSRCGEGLRIWQYPNQLAPYFIKLSSLGIRSYLEIGVRHGGTFVATVEYLSRFNPLRSAIGVDMCESATLNKYSTQRHGIEFFKMDSHSPEFAKLIREARVDAALIDGDHSEHGCWRDFECVHGFVPIIALHDILSDSCPGVGRVWRKLKRQFADHYTFEEFTEQYASVQERTRERYLGLGIAISKSR